MLYLVKIRHPKTPSLPLTPPPLALGALSLALGPLFGQDPHRRGEDPGVSGSLTNTTLMVQTVSIATL